MIKIYIDEQRTRQQWRVRVMENKVEKVAHYADTLSGAKRIKKMLRKTINSILNIEAKEK